MKTLEIADAMTWLMKYIDDPEQRPVILTHKKKPIVVVLPVHGADVETISVSLNPKFNEIMERSRSRYDQEGGFSSEEVRRELGLPPASNGNSSPRSSKTTAKRRAKRQRT